MANPEHVEIVKRGADAIRKCGEENRGVQLDLRKASLIGANLSQANVIRANLISADLREANLGVSLGRCGRAR